MIVEPNSRIIRPRRRKLWTPSREGVQCVVNNVQVWTEPATGEGTSSTPATAGSNTSSGNLVVVDTISFSGTATVTGGPNFTITDNQGGLTWHLVAGSSIIFDGGQCYEQYWTVANTGPLTVTSSAVGGGSAGTNVNLVCAEYSGCAPSGPSHVSQGNNVFSGSVSSGNISPSAGDLVVGGYFDSFGLTSSSYGTFSSGSTNNGIQDAYQLAVMSIWQIAAGGAVAYNGVGRGGFASSTIVSYPAATSAGIPVPFWAT